MSNIFKSKFLNEYFAQGLENDNFTLEDLKGEEYISIVNEEDNQYVKINSEDLQILCDLDCTHLDFDGIDFSETEFPEATLENLEFSNCKLSTCDLKRLQVTDGLVLYNNIELEDNNLIQFKHMKQIRQFHCVDCENLDLSEIENLTNIEYLKIQGNVTNISGISELKQLKRVEISTTGEISKYLPITDTLKDIDIKDPDLTDIGFLKNYPNLEHIKLLKSQIDVDSLDTLCELKRKGIQISYDETKIKEELTKRKYEFEGKDAEDIKVMFNLPKDIELNDYEILKKFTNREINLELEDIGFLDRLIKSGILSKDSIVAKLGIINGLDFQLENLEGITSDVINYISQNKDEKFRFILRTLNGLDSKILNELSENDKNMEFFIQGDLWHFQNRSDTTIYKCRNIGYNDLSELVPYNLEEMKEFVDFLEPIKDEASFAKDDLEKFALIRKVALIRTSYDEKGNQGSEEFNEASQINTRSLYGMFLEGKSVCAGNALGLYILAEYIGLSAKIIDGKCTNIDDGILHTWNQIRLKDKNGIPNWYNYDITNDKGNYNLNAEKVLEDDLTFYKKWKPFSFVEREECDKNISGYDIEQKNLDIILRNKEQGNKKIIGAGEYSGRKITKQDIKNIISALTLSEISYLTQIMRQEIDMPLYQKEM